ncbi:caspase family protein [Afipia sp. DC4300-2b1]|uniref:caspase family protein n=1 Tax=Afipia sp. DC4300-2b1 TaxID=2804672 RepID=UPI003CEEED11
MRRLLLVWTFLTAALTPALAEKRVALVIGNSDYQNVAPLTNPSNDAAAIAAILTKAGFDTVDAKSNLSGIEMKRTLREFGNKVRDADVAVIYYAGHGIELEGTNYLIPVDAKLEIDTDVLDEAFPLDRFIVAADPAKHLRLVILDACRDNPFNKTMKRTIGSRAVNRGLAKVEPANPNTLIAFAAKAGSTASDGEGKNSPFATALVKHLVKPGLDLRKAFGFVRDDVLKVTNNKQEPFVYGSLGGNDVSLVPAVAAAPPVSAQQMDPNSSLRRDYELAERVGTREAWDYFIATYPDSFYAKLAQAQRNKLAAEEARLAATEKAKTAQEEQTRLAIEGAKKAEQDKAAELARKAEQQRVAAELAKKAEEAKLAEAEKAKAAALAKAEERARAAADKKAAEDARVADAARLAAEKKAAERKTTEQKASDDKPIGPVAALTPDQSAPKPDAPVIVADVPKQLQIELKRAGCYAGATDGNWTAAAQKSLDLFNKNAKTKFDIKLANADALDAVKAKQGRVCPLVCEWGYKADGDKCSKITCRAGYEVGDDNTCEKIEVKKKPEPVAKRDEPVRGEKPEKTAQKPALNREALYARCSARMPPIINGSASAMSMQTQYAAFEACIASGGR